jgi:perosamine synthetase
MNMLLSAPDIGEREIDYVSRALRSKQLSTGPWLEEFEKQFAAYCGTSYAVATNNGTSALHLCVRALGIGPKDEVITTSFSFVASVNCFLYEGALPALVDIDPETLNLDPGSVHDFLRNQCVRASNGDLIDHETNRVVKAILPVHVFGLPCAMDELMDIADEYGLFVLEDACDAIGAEVKRRRVGTFGNAGVFAFYPNKQMTTGEGGMITTNDRRIAELCRTMRNHGRGSNGTSSRHVTTGYSYRLSELHAALGLAQLERIDHLLAVRTRIARKYTRSLSELPQLQLFQDPATMTRSWFIYPVRFRGNSPAIARDRVRDRLHADGIPTQVYFTPIHHQPFFKQCYPGMTAVLPHTDRAAESCLALPFHSGLREDEIEFVCDELRSALESSSPSANIESLPAVSAAYSAT